MEGRAEALESPQSAGPHPDHADPGHQCPAHERPGPCWPRALMWCEREDAAAAGSLSLVSTVRAGWMEKALPQPAAVGALLLLMHQMGRLLPKQTLAVCLWVLCHRQLRSWGGFTATWCQTTNPDCHANVVIRILCFCLLMVPQNSNNYTKHRLTSLPECSMFIYTHFHSQSAEPRL